MELKRAILNGNADALEMVKTLLDNPMLVCLNPPFAISLEVDTIEKQGQAEVSQYPVIVQGKQQKQYLADNIAPMPLSWQMNGFIPGNSGIETRNIFTPIVQLNTDFLWLAFKRGSRIIYKDLDQHLYMNCVISAFMTKYESDCKNKRPFSMTLNEIVEIDAATSTLNETQKASQPTDATKKIGTTATESATDSIGDSFMKRSIHKGLNFMGINL